jgi:large subunit ribosomal protein L16
MFFYIFIESFLNSIRTFWWSTLTPSVSVFNFKFDCSIIRVKLPLQPKSFKSKRRQKIRKLFKFNNNSLLKFGDSGLLVLRPLIFTSIQLSRLKLFLKRASKKGDKTHRKMWFNLFPHLPFSKKPANVRMGKGKGKLKTWFAYIRGGGFILEYKNLRQGRLLYFFRQATFKFGTRTIIVYSKSFFFNFPFRKDKKVFLKSYWS